jgi:hypothetical protein
MLSFHPLLGFLVCFFPSDFLTEILLARPSHKKQKTKSVAFRLQANYTDWATATCWRNLVPTFGDRGVSRGQRGGSRAAVNLSFLDRSRYFSFK